MSLLSKYADKVLLQRGWVIVLFESKNIFGDDCFAYILTNNEKIKDLERAMNKHEMLDITQYGQITHSGSGRPSDDDYEIALAEAKENLV